MYLQVSPAGSKRGLLKYPIASLEKRLALGSYPAVNLPAVRKACDAAKLQKAAGEDPVKTRKIEKRKVSSNEEDAFKTIALEWYDKQASYGSPSHAVRMLRPVNPPPP